MKKKWSQKIGQLPGSLMHIGEVKVDEIKISMIDYNDELYEEKMLTSIPVSLKPEGEEFVRWVNVNGLHEVEAISSLCDAFGIHTLVQEDLLNTGQRPKLDDYGDYIYLNIHTHSFNNETSEVEIEQIGLILGKNFVLSFHEGETDYFDLIQLHLKEDTGRLRKLKGDHLMYTLLDVIVDHYFVLIEQLSDRIEDIEDEMVLNSTPDTLQIIQKLRRQILFVHKSLWPMREVVGRLSRGELELINENLTIFLKDVYDHIIQLIDSTETLRELVASLQDLYLSSVSNRMNEVMKVLAIISTIFMPLSFIVGFYGMNFKYMPELKWTWSYPAIITLMIAIVFAMRAYFKNKKWW